MPFVVIDGVVVDPEGSAERLSAVRAAHEHHVGPVVGAGRPHTGKHVNVVVCNGAGAVHRQEYLSCESSWIDRCAELYAAAEIDGSNLVKSWRDVPVLCVARANAVKVAPKFSTADKEIAVGVHVECPPDGRVGNSDRTHPGDAAVSGTAELPATASGGGAPSLVLEPVTHAVGFIYGKPLLVAPASASLGWQTRPGLAAVQRAPHVITKCLQEAKVEKIPCLIRV